MMTPHESAGSNSGNLVTRADATQGPRRMYPGIFGATLVMRLQAMDAGRPLVS